MLNVYVIREGGGKTTSTLQLPDIAHLIDQGKLKFTGKKLKQSRGELTTFRYYIRVDREPRAKEICKKPCCGYIEDKKEKDNDSEIQDPS